MARSLALLLALLVLVPTLAAAQGPPATTAKKGDVPADTVGSRAVRDRTLRGIDLRKGAIQVGNLNLSTIPGVLQSRVSGRCDGDEALRAIARDGSATCVPLLEGTISGVSVTGGLTGGGTTGAVTIGVDPNVIQSRVSGTCQTGEVLRSIGADGGVGCAGVISEVNAGPGLGFSAVPGRVNLFADTAFLQKRVTGTCAANQALTAIDGDGGVTCGQFQVPVGGCLDVDQALRAIGPGVSRECFKVLTNLTGGNGITVTRNSSDGGAPVLSADATFLQRRVTGSCETGTAVRAVAQDGSVTCSGQFAPASRLLESGGVVINAGGADQTLLTGAGGLLLRARCLTGPVRSEVYLTAPSFVILDADTRSLGARPLQGTSVTIGSTTGDDRGDFDAFLPTSSLTTLRGSYFSYINGQQCVFSAGGTAGPTGLSARGDAAAVPARLP